MRFLGGASVKKDSSTESWGKIEMTDEWIQLAQTNPHRIHFIMPFIFKQLGEQKRKIKRPPVRRSNFRDKLLGRLAILHLFKDHCWRGSRPFCPQIT